jgi:hypothetical protein
MQSFEITLNVLTTHVKTVAFWLWWKMVVFGRNVGHLHPLYLHFTVVTDIHTFIYQMKLLPNGCNSGFSVFSNKYDQFCSLIPGNYTIYRYTEFWSISASLDIILIDITGVRNLFERRRWPCTSCLRAYLNISSGGVPAVLEATFFKNLRFNTFRSGLGGRGVIVRT